MTDPWIWIEFLRTNNQAKINFLEFLDFLSTKIHSNLRKIIAEDYNLAVKYTGQLDLIDDIKRRYLIHEKEEQAYDDFQQKTK